MPEVASRSQSARARGSGIRRMRIREKRMVQAMTNLMPAKVMGGRAARPSLINSQVEPQIPQRINQTSRAFINYFQLPIANCQFVIQLAIGLWQLEMNYPCRCVLIIANAA